MYFQINTLKQIAVSLLRFVELGAAYICDIHLIITIYWEEKKKEKEKKERKPLQHIPQLFIQGLETVSVTANTTEANRSTSTGTSRRPAPRSVGNLKPCF